MLNLAAPTDPAWVDCALAGLDELLLDHAHCEKKAAGTAVQLLFRYPHHRFLQEPLSRLAREELVHFEQVLDHLEQRGIRFRAQRPIPYGSRLRELRRGREPERLVDTLLCCALIEARSCERFELLARAVPDPALSRFYAGLLASEARHHRTYVDLAEELVPRSAVRERLLALAAREADVVASGAPRARMHG